MTMRSFRDAVIALVGADESSQITWRQTACMLVVYWEPDSDIGVKELARIMRVSKPAVTRSIDRLVEEKLAYRASHKSDMRKISLRLTPAGRALAKRIEDLWPRGIGKALASVL